MAYVPQFQGIRQAGKAIGDALQQKAERERQALAAAEKQAYEDAKLKFTGIGQELGGDLERYRATPTSGPIEKRAKLYGETLLAGVRESEFDLQQKRIAAERAAQEQRRMAAADAVYSQTMAPGSTPEKQLEMEQAMLRSTDPDTVAGVMGSRQRVADQRAAQAKAEKASFEMQSAKDERNVELMVSDILGSVAGLDVADAEKKITQAVKAAMAPDRDGKPRPLGRLAVQAGVKALDILRTQGKDIAALYSMRLQQKKLRGDIKKDEFDAEVLRAKNKAMSQSPEKVQSQIDYARNLLTTEAGAQLDKQTRSRAEAVLAGLLDAQEAQLDIASKRGSVEQQRVVIAKHGIKGRAQAILGDFNNQMSQLELPDVDASMATDHLLSAFAKREEAMNGMIDTMRNKMAQEMPLDSPDDIAALEYQAFGEAMSDAMAAFYEKRDRMVGERLEMDRAKAKAEGKPRPIPASYGDKLLGEIATLKDMDKVIALLNDPDIDTGDFWFNKFASKAGQVFGAELDPKWAKVADLDRRLIKLRGMVKHMIDSGVLTNQDQKRLEQLVPGIGADETEIEAAIQSLRESASNSLATKVAGLGEIYTIPSRAYQELKFVPGERGPEGNVLSWTMPSDWEPRDPEADQVLLWGGGPSATVPQSMLGTPSGRKNWEDAAGNPITEDQARDMQARGEEVYYTKD